MDTVKEDFLEETKEQLSQIENEILEIENQGKNFDPNLLEDIFRVIHSVKGSSGFLNLDTITKLTHSIEDVLANIKDKYILPDEKVTEALLNGIDKLKILINTPEDHENIDIEPEVKSLKEIIAEADKKKSTEEMYSNYRIKIDLIEECDKKNRLPLELFSNIKKNGQIIEAELDLESVGNALTKISDRLLYSFTISTLIKEKKKLLKVLDVSPISIKEISLEQNNEEEVSDYQSPTINSQDTTNSDMESKILAEKANRLNFSKKERDNIEKGLKKGDTLYEIKATFIDDCIMCYPRAFLVYNNLTSAGSIIKTIPNVFLETDDIFFQEFYVYVISDSKANRLKQYSSVDQLKEIEVEEIDYSGLKFQEQETKKENSASAKQKTEVEKNKKSPHASDKEIKKSTDKKNTKSSIRISLPILDKLMKLAGELVLIRNQNSQYAKIGNLPQLKSSAKKLNVITSEIETCIMQTRMQPIAKIFSKFHRYARDLGKDLDKDITIDITGESVELDNSIIEALADPLTHLIRNAIDHGIESPDEREAKNKPRAGNIKLSAMYQAGHVVIKVEDNGKGINPKKLIKTALRKKIITSQKAKALSDHDAYNLIFKQGFSTAEKISKISGRGVGMDVVKTNIQKLNGTIEIFSKVDTGTTFEIRMPLTLSIMKALIIAIKGLYFAIPEINISEAIWLYGSEIKQKLKIVNNQEIIALRDEIVPVLRLPKILKLGEDNFFDKEIIEEEKSKKGIVILKKNSIFILMLKVNNIKYGLIIEEIIDTEEIVIKPLHKQLEKCQAFSGTTMLGDGKIAFILNAANLAKLGDLNLKQLEDKKYEKDGSNADRQSIITFTIGAMEHFAIPLFLINRIEKITKDQIMSADNKEYYNFQNDIIPVIRIEKNFASLQTNYKDELFVIIIKGKKPIGILASKITETTKITDTFETSAVPKPGIIGFTILHKELVLVLDIYKIIAMTEPIWYQKHMKQKKLDKKILLLEEQEFYSALIKSYLRDTGIELLVVHNSKEAISALTKINFDFIISEYRRNYNNAEEIIKYVKGQKKFENIKLLALSNAPNENYDKKIIEEAGYHDIISKFSREDMLSSLKKYIITKG